MKVVPKTYYTFEYQRMRFFFQPNGWVEISDPIRGVVLLVTVAQLRAICATWDALGGGEEIKPEMRGELGP